MKPGAARLLPLGAVIAAAIAGCTEINSSADHVAAIEFPGFPSPAVVSGDTLRDSLGVAAPVRAIAFNGAGTEIADAAIQYIVLDTGVTINANGILVAQRTSGAVRIVASAGSIQSPAESLTVARRPAVVIVPGKLRDTINYIVPDNPGLNVSTGLGVKIITADTADGIGVTRGWLVSYQAFFRNQAVAPGDTSVVFLLDDGVKRTGLDTTGTDGTASRRLRVRPIGITQSAVDSVIVMATVRYRGAQVQGSPVRFVVLLRPK